MIEIVQFKYYGENSPYNFPENILREDFNGIICPTSEMLYKYQTMVRLIVNTIPGTILYIYGNDKEQSILKYIVGATGTLDLDLSQLYISIKGITIDPASIEILKNNPENYFVLTVVYNATEKKEGTE